MNDKFKNDNFKCVIQIEILEKWAFGKSFHIISIESADGKGKLFRSDKFRKEAKEKAIIEAARFLEEIKLV